MKATLATLTLFITLISTPLTASDTIPTLVPNKVSGRTYYHLELTLTPANSSLVVPPGYKSRYRTEDVATFDRNGSFEVYVRVTDFPVPSYGCNGDWLILRMPSTPADTPDFDTKSAGKRDLWDRLQKMYTSKNGETKVVVELNPDGGKTIKDCNVYFRTAQGAYVPYLGALQTTETKKK